MYSETVPRIASERRTEFPAKVLSSTLRDPSILCINDAADVGHAQELSGASNTLNRVLCAGLGRTKMREPLILEKEVQQFSQVVLSSSVTLVLQ